MYSIVEYNSNEEIIGCVNFDKLNADSALEMYWNCLLYTSPSPRDLSTSRMPSSA